MGSLIQVVFDIFAALGFFVIIMRMNRAPKDDPRLSRGLQLLQSKISVLEDLSDRTETQVNQMGALLDQKSKEVQAKIQLAEAHVHEIRVSMQNSLEVAKIFQDKIPHQEIIERQNSMKYVQAARFAHQGLSVEEIAAKIDLPKGEIEFISKVNREQLMFNEEHLPEWAKDPAVGFPRPGEGSQATSPAPTVPFSAAQAQAQMNSYIQGHGAGVATDSSEPGTEHQASYSGAELATEGALAHLGFEEEGAEPGARLRAEIEIAERQRLVENLSRLQFEMQNLDIQLARENGSRDLSAAFEAPRTESESLQKIGEEFRKACDDANQAAQQAAGEGRKTAFPPLEQLSSLIPQILRPDGSIDTPSGTRAPEPAPAPASAALTGGAVGGYATSHAASGQTSAAYRNSMAQDERPRDPVLARALAQSKIDAALRSSAPAAMPAPRTSPELSAARALAKELSATQTQSPAQPRAQAPAPAAAQAATPRFAASPVINGRPSTTAPVIRRVQFPKIESPEG